MNDSAALERRYRRLLAAFPADHQREYGEEMIGVLLASAPEGRRRPKLADAVDLIASGLRARLILPRTELADANWPDALAVYCVAIPVTLLAALAVSYMWNLATGYGLGNLSDFYPPSLALAVPPLIALRYRRSAAVVTLAAAAWLCFLVLRSLSAHVDGLEACYCLALLVQVIALAGSPGPRRAAAILTWKTWLVLCATGIFAGLASISFPWPLLTWQAAALAIAIPTVVAGGLVLTLPRPVAFRLLLLVAIPVVPLTVWALQLAGIVTAPFPELAIPSVLLLACVTAAAAWRATRDNRTA